MTAATWLRNGAACAASWHTNDSIRAPPWMTKLSIPPQLRKVLDEAHAAGNVIE
jgi:hypothetical protein